MFRTFSFIFLCSNMCTKPILYPSNILSFTLKRKTLLLPWYYFLFICLLFVFHSEKKDTFCFIQKRKTHPVSFRNERHILRGWGKLFKLKGPWYWIFGTSVQRQNAEFSVFVFENPQVLRVSPRPSEFKIFRCGTFFTSIFFVTASFSVHF